MNDNLTALATVNRQKALKTINLLAASLNAFQPFDPSAPYTPKALEPYDALSDRFIRAVECALRYFRSLELSEFAEQSDTTRTLLNRMAKMRLISDPDLWLTMRNVRNRMVHDYLPEQTAQMFNEISTAYGPELLALEQKILSPTTSD
ncbi:MAG: nucleotidyltransferase substrate binding protein [Rhodocyclaceae bacterium]|nr:nucleotidyltransferase substrate binding protein [Rhodocyclaceae bacterium]